METSDGRLSGIFKEWLGGDIVKEAGENGMCHLCETGTDSGWKLAMDD